MPLYRAHVQLWKNWTVYVTAPQNTYFFSWWRRRRIYSLFQKNKQKRLSFKLAPSAFRNQDGSIVMIVCAFCISKLAKIRLIFSSIFFHPTWRDDCKIFIISYACGEHTLNWAQTRPHTGWRTERTANGSGEWVTMRRIHFHTRATHIWLDHLATECVVCRLELWMQGILEKNIFEKAKWPKCLCACLEIGHRAAVWCVCAYYFTVSGDVCAVHPKTFNFLRDFHRFEPKKKQTAFPSFLLYYLLLLISTNSVLNKFLFISNSNWWCLAARN